MKLGQTLATLAAGLLLWTAVGASEGVRWIVVDGDADCLELSNATTRVVLGPHRGGRVLSYRLDGHEALQQASLARSPAANRPSMLAGGRFDIGPEHILPPHPVLWSGPWRAEITGDRAGRLTSGTDPATGMQLVRDFVLDPESSRLRCTQTMINRGAGIRSVFHWSRTFASPGGTCVVPLNPASRFPRGYAVHVMGEDKIDFRPAPDPAVQVRDGLLLIGGQPRHRKFVIDASEGWMAYVGPDGLLFAKHFPVYPNRSYGEITANSICVWYDPDRACELEPIGPLERLAPGGQAMYTEEWSLHPFAAKAGGPIDVEAVRRLVQSLSPPR